MLSTLKLQRHMSKKLLWVLTLPLLMACSQEDLPPLDADSGQEKTSAFSRPINECLDYANDFFKEIEGEGTRGSERKVKSIELLPVMMRTRSIESDFTSFYVVNFENEEGFAILSGNKLQTPIYAIAETGNIELKDTVHNKGLSQYLHEILPSLAQSELEMSAETRYTIDPSINIPTYGWKVSVKPLLTKGVRMWDQTSPYNEYCPLMDDERTVPGCIAVVCAQAMSVFQIPLGYKGYVFDWTDMLASETNDQKLKVARLLKLVGEPENLNVTYGTKASSGVIQNISRTFENMGYKPLTYSSFNSKTAYKLLKSGTPVLTDGSRYISSEDREAGHIFVIDGSGSYTAFGVNDMKKHGAYFHCVWGWGGDANGYYLYCSDPFSQSDSEIGGGDPFRDPEDDTTGTGNTYSNLCMYSKIEPK